MHKDTQSKETNSCKHKQDLKRLNYKYARAHTHTHTHTHFKLSLSFEFKVSKILEDSFQRYDSFILEYKGRRKKGVGREREEREE